MTGDGNSSSLPAARLKGRPKAGLRIPDLLWRGSPGRRAAGLAAFAATLALAALNQHAPYNITPGVLAHALAASAPLLAAAVAALAVLAPWSGFLAVLLLVPYWDAAQVAWQVGPVQILLQTVFVLALGTGTLLRLRGGEGGGDWRGRLRPWRPTLAVVLGLLGLVSLSTLASPDRTTSVNVMLHGIVEPIAFGALLVVQRPDRRRLALVGLVLGVSVGLGGLINLVQTIPDVGSLAALQAERLLFARLTYFNVGLFGEMLAMAVPLLIGAVALRSWLRPAGLTTAAALVALAISGLCLYLTFSKSAWLATASGVIVLAVLLAHTWHRRIAVVLLAVFVSGMVVPWPAAVLGVVSPRAAAAYRDVMISLVGSSRYNSWDPATLAGRGSLLERLWATEAAVRMAIDHPLLGIGLDRFKAEYVGGYRPPQAHLALDSAHSFWPEIAAELGLPALGLVIVLFAMAVLAAWRTYRSPPDEATRRLAAALLAALVAWLIVASTFAGDMYRPWRNMASDFVMMSVLTAAALALPRVAGRRVGPEPS